MTKLLDTAIAKVRQLSDAEQDHAGELLMQLAQAAEDTVYVLSPDEQSAVEEALAQVARGQYATDEEMSALWRKCGL